MISVVMLGASGAVGGQVVAALLDMPELERLTLLNRRPLPGDTDRRLTQHIVDVLDPRSYQHLLAGHDCAVCTLGVGQPTKADKAEFIRVDKDAVVSFGGACKQAGVRHFELLGSVGADPKSGYFYLRIKGELKDALTAMQFPRLSFFQPSMILTPMNRYGTSQAIMLALWPMLKPLLIGPLRKYRGVRVEALGAAMARNLVGQGAGVETLHWDDFQQLL